MISLVLGVAGNDFWQRPVHVDSPWSLKCWLSPAGSTLGAPGWQLAFVAMQDNQLLSYLCVRVQFTFPLSTFGLISSDCH